MQPYRAVEAAKSQVIDRIQLRYEMLTGTLVQGERLSRVKKLPLDYQRRLEDELDRASKTGERPSSILVRILFKFDEECRAKEKAKWDAIDPNPAGVMISPRASSSPLARSWRI